MLSIKQLASNSLIYGIGGAITKSISLLSLPIFTKYLSPLDYGVLSLILFLSAFIQPLVTLGLNTSMGISYFKSNTIENKSQTVWSSFILLGISSILFFIILYYFIQSVGNFVFQNTLYDNLILVAMFSMLLNVLSTPFILKMQFENQAKSFIILSFISALLTLLLTVYFIAYLQKGIVGMIYGQLLGSLFSFFFFIYFGKKDLVFIFDVNYLKSIFKLGYPLIPSSIFLLIIFQSNRYILELFEGLEAVGIYSIGFSFGMLMSIFVSGFTQAWYPYFMSFANKQDQIKEKFADILYLYSLVFGALSLLFFILAKIIVEMFVSIEFYKSYQVIGLVALSQVCIGLFSILTPNIYYLKKVKIITYFQAIAAILSIFINTLFIVLFGVFGAAIGLFVSSALLPLFQFLWNRYFLDNSIKIDYSVWSNKYLFIITFGTITASFFIVNSLITILIYCIALLLVVSYQKPNFYKTLLEKI